MSLSFRRFCLLGILALLVALAPGGGTVLAAGPYIVTKTADTNGTCASGTNCSLREAIKAANAAPGEIQFNIPTSDPGYQAGGGYWRISVQSTALPAISGGSTTINGLGSDGKPKIELNGGGTIGPWGLMLTSGNNTIKGLIVNGFIATPQGGFGVLLYGETVKNNTITNNYIGTNYNGTAAGGTTSSNNTVAGIALQFGASTNVIENNVISGNGGYGIYSFTSVGFVTPLRQSGNIIRNNKIGVNGDGSAALGNRNSGVYVGDNSVDTQIGPGNVISGNGATGADTVFGVNIGGYLGTQSAFISGTRVTGNKIGTDATGTKALPNAGGGVQVTSSTGTVIGGAGGNPATPGGTANLISGNSIAGVRLKDSIGFGAGTSNNVVTNNWIGLNIAGTAALPNGSGVYFSNSANNFTVGPNNVISGNRNDGVLIEASNNATAAQQVRLNTITGNLIGTDASGNAAVPNQGYGVQLRGGTFTNTITGNRITNNATGGVYLAPSTNATPASPTQNTFTGNTISSNGAVGITLTSASSQNVIGAPGAGNIIQNHSSSGIEVQSAGNTIQANDIRLNQIGVLINNAAGNTIGGASVAAGNNLHNNTLHGVLVNGSTATGNRISHTVTSANGGKGIALAAGGNAPIAAARVNVTPPASGFTLTGSVSSCATPGCTVEIFTDDSPLTDEGPTFLTSVQPAAGGAFSADITGCKHYLIFTLTDSAGNTSEFVNPTSNIAQCVPAAPAVQITTADPQPPRAVLPGTTTTYVHTVKNVGTGAGAVSVLLNQTPNTWATITNNTCSGQSLAPQATCTFNLQVVVPANAQAGNFNQSTLTVAIGSASAQQVDRTTVLSQPALTFVPDPTPSSNAKSTGPGQPVTYQHKLTNTGNGTDSFIINVTPPNGWTYSVQSATVSNLAPNASAIVTLVLTPTAGISSPPDYPTTVTAHSVANPNVAATVTDTTTIISSAVPQIISSTATPSPADPGSSVVLAYTVKNVGNLGGTFNLVLSVPPGWTVSQAIPPAVTLATGATTVVQATVQVPANALAGSYRATLTATDQANSSVSASGAATIEVSKRAALTIGPDFDDPTAYTPGRIVTYTTTLQNAGNFTDTVGLAASASRGWPVQLQPTSTVLGPGQSKQIQLELTIPPGQVALPKNVTTITATSSLVAVPPVRDTAVITTSLAEIAAVALTPAQQTQPLLDTKPVTFTFALLNSGSIPQSFALNLSGLPNGWQATLTPTQTATLQPNQSVNVQLVLKAPTGLPNGQEFTLTLNASCRENNCAGDSAVAIVRVGPPVQLGGECNTSALPGTTVTCLHTLKNSSAVTDTFTIGAVSYLGWPSTLTPQVVVLGPGATRTFTATITVPTSAPANVVERLKITAASTAFPQNVQQVTDLVTVLQYARLSFVASQNQPLLPGETITFRHQLINTSNGNDRFVITATQQLDWNITITPASTGLLVPGFTYPVTVQVDVPGGVAEDTVNRITVRATSVFSPTVYEELTDVIGVARAPTTSLIIYLPVAHN